MSTVYTFKWPKGPQEVVLTGTFDNWSKSLYLVKQADGSFELTVPLPSNKERILYKYIVDGEWKVSSNEKIGKDDSGIENNVLESKDLVNSKSAGSRIPESGGLLAGGLGAGGLAGALTGGLAGNHNSKQGDVNTTVMPSTEGKHATVAGEPGIVIPQDKDSLAAFNTFNDEGNKEVNTSELTPEEKKKQKKKVKRSQYKAKKKKKAAESAAVGGSAAGVPGAFEGTSGASGVETEGETEPESTPEPQNALGNHATDSETKDLQSETKKDNEVEKVLAASGIAGTGAGVGAAAAAATVMGDSKDANTASGSSTAPQTSDFKNADTPAFGGVSGTSSGPQSSELKDHQTPTVGGTAAQQSLGESQNAGVSSTKPETDESNNNAIPIVGGALAGATGGAAVHHFVTRPGTEGVSGVPSSAVGGSSAIPSTLDPKAHHDDKNLESEPQAIGGSQGAKPFESQKPQAVGGSNAPYTKGSKQLDTHQPQVAGGNVDPRAQQAQPQVAGGNVDPRTQQTQPQVAGGYIDPRTQQSSKQVEQPQVVSKEQDTTPLQSQPQAIGGVNDIGTEKEVDASPVTNNEGISNQRKYSDSEIVIAQGDVDRERIEAELRAREKGDIIVEEFQPTESEKQRLALEAQLVDKVPADTNATSNSATALGANTSSATHADVIAESRREGEKQAKKDAVKKDTTKKDTTKKDTTKKDEKKKGGLFSKLKRVFK